jgi:hypothetical protein
MNASRKVADRTYVRFISRGFGVNDYGVSIAGTESRVHLSDAGEFSAIARDATKEEIAAVKTFLAAEHAEYLVWKAEFDAKHGQAA